MDVDNQVRKTDDPLIISLTVREPTLVLEADINIYIKQYEDGTNKLKEFSLKALDDGQGDDLIKNDGVYTATFTQTDIKGNYCIEADINGVTDLAGIYYRNKQECLYFGY